MPVVPPFLAVLLLHLAVLQGVAHSEADCGQNGSWIVGRKPANTGEWSQLISILYNGEHFCGGFLIAKQWVVTAAHCVNESMSNYTVLVHAAHRFQNFIQWYRKRTTMNQIIPNANFSGNKGSSGDIALVELSSPVTFISNILPICLPDPSAQFPNGANCWVTGGGQIQTGVDLGYPQHLQELEVPIIDRDTCNYIFGVAPEADLGPNPVKEDMICTGYDEGGQDACQVDSGGPVVCESNVGWVLAGVASWGDGCAQGIRPVVFTSVPYYADWISKYIPNMTFVECKNCDRNAGKKIGPEKAFSLLPLLGCLMFALR
ncbi:serine protease 27-like [Eublepharis macularius]|uniref:Serine protease 27-like n=1 Tax=Eublepharis macularius TaxID=481883 RepID=A0AA97K6M3_EUBMA|nr:serine protease 27-like [Eublepharis macularius]